MAYHPDRNPNDPQASTRFIALSNAYSVLSIPSKRTEYDSTISMNTQADRIPHGTYSSVNFAGGRSPSGLSRRRAQFRGPPPSFYRNGCWGSYSEKRQETYRENINLGQNGSSARTQAPYSASFDASGPNQNQFRHDPYYQHFDINQHFRTQENHRRRRQARSKDGREVSDDEIPKGLFGEFVSVAVILVVGVFVPLTVMNSVPVFR